MPDVDIVGDDEEVLNVKVGRPTVGPSIFEVSLNNYPVQPWLNPRAPLSQWFNYGFNPATFTRYAMQQTNLAKK